MIKDIIIHIEDALLTVAQGHDRRRGDGGEEPAGLRGGDFRWSRVRAGSSDRLQPCSWFWQRGAETAARPRTVPVWV